MKPYILFFICSLLFASCKKNNEPPITPPKGKVVFYLVENDCDTVEITCANQNGKLTKIFKFNEIECGADGAYTLSLDTGTYDFKATCGTMVMEDKVSVKQNECYRQAIAFEIRFDLMVSDFNTQSGNYTVKHDFYWKLLEFHSDEQIFEFENNGGIQKNISVRNVKEVGSGQPFQQDKFVYNSDGTIRQQETWVDGEKQRWAEYKYNSNGTINEILNYDDVSAGELPTNRIKFIWKNGNLIQLSNQSYSTNETIYAYEYTYHDNAANRLFKRYPQAWIIFNDDDDTDISLMSLLGSKNLLKGCKITYGSGWGDWLEGNWDYEFYPDGTISKMIHNGQIEHSYTYKYQ